MIVDIAALCFFMLVVAIFHKQDRIADQRWRQWVKEAENESRTGNRLDGSMSSLTAVSDNSGTPNYHLGAS